jgi:hypothetical protein
MEDSATPTETGTATDEPRLTDEDLLSQTSHFHGLVSMEGDIQALQDDEDDDQWRCWTCWDKGHLSWQCPVTPAKVICAKCYRYDHSAEQCLTPSGWQPSACYECGEPGHTAKQCPIQYLVWGTGVGDRPGSWLQCRIHNVPRGVCNLYISEGGQVRCKQDALCQP